MYFSGSLDYSICVLNLSERGLSDDRLNQIIINVLDAVLWLLVIINVLDAVLWLLVIINVLSIQYIYNS
jgi:hypothetical protein